MRTVWSLVREWRTPRHENPSDIEMTSIESQLLQKRSRGGQIMIFGWTEIYLSIIPHILRSLTFLVDKFFHEVVKSVWVCSNCEWIKNIMPREWIQAHLSLLQVLPPRTERVSGKKLWHGAVISICLTNKSKETGEVRISVKCWYNDQWDLSCQEIWALNQRPRGQTHLLGTHPWLVLHSPFQKSHVRRGLGGCVFGGGGVVNGVIVMLHLPVLLVT